MESSPTDIAPAPVPPELLNADANQPEFASKPLITEI
jgi:hypothetical protein